MSVNFLRQGISVDYRKGGPLTTPDYQSNASMQMKSVYGKINSSSTTTTPQIILNTDNVTTTYIVQNLMVTNTQTSTYNSVELTVGMEEANFFLGQNGRYERNLMNQRLIGPNQTAQLISKDTSVVLGIQLQNVIFESNYGRIASIRIQHSGPAIDYFMSYLEITYV
jgi:hypothetical protein